MLVAFPVHGRRRRVSCRAVSSGLLLVALAPPALGQSADQSVGRSLGISLGVWDLGDEEATLLGLDYGFRPRRWGLEPHIGVAATEDSTFYGYAGVRRHYRLGGRFVATPSFAISLWEQGDGKDLGHVVEFRSGLAISRQLASGARIGVGIYHLSNSSLASRNPGSNELLFRLVLPTARNRRGAP